MPIAPIYSNNQDPYTSNVINFSETYHGTTPYENVLPNTPAITSVDAYYNQKTGLGKSWKGIGVDFRTQYINAATKIELKINRADNTTYSAFAKQSVLDAINSQAAKQTPTSQSGVIAIQPGDYEGSWEQSSTPWTGTSVPRSVEVIITLSDNSIVTFPADTTIGTRHATWEQVKPVDTTAPSFSIESPANGQHVSGTIVLKAKITDGSDITKVLMNIGGISRSWTNGSSSTITRTDDVFSTIVDTSMLPEGPVYVTLRGTDGAGNTRYWNNNAKSRQHVFYVDRTAPTAQVTGVTPIYNDNIGGSNVKVSFRVNDASEINLDRTYVMFADGPGTTKQHKESSKIYLKNLEQSADGVYVATFDTKKFVAENYTGRYNLQFTLVDVHGNNTSTKPIEYRNILIDNSGPGSALSTPASGSYVQGKEAKLTFTLSDDTGVSSVRVRLTNTVTGFEKWYNVNVTDFSDTEGSLTFDTTELPEGEYTITIRPVDSFGQPRSGPNKGTVIVDRTAPVIAITSATPSLITGTVGADAEKVLVRVGDQPEREATIGEDGTTWTLTISPALTAGADVIARAVDAANNTNSASTNPKWATGTIYVRTPVTNGPLESRNDAPSQGGSSAILANTAATPLLNNANAAAFAPITGAVTTDGTNTTNSDEGDVAAATTQSAETNEDGEVLAAEDNKQAWSLVNLLLTIGIVLASLVALSGLGRKENRRAAVRILSLVPAAGALVLLFAAENFTAPMGWVNTWSWLMAAIALAQIIILSMTRKSSDVE